MRIGPITFLLTLVVFTLAMETYAGEGHNHVHIEQLNSGDNLELNIDQIGYGNTINFSFDHANNTFNFTQKGAGNTISWVPWWGSGKSWGGDVDGSGNDITIDQEDGATYGAHIWGNNNIVDVTQKGDHDTFLDVHADGTTTEIWQQDSGSKYARIYYYGTADDSTTDLMQKGTGTHTAYITLQGSETTDLTLIQQGNTTQSYSLTQTCVTVGGCSVTVTQGN